MDGIQLIDYKENFTIMMPSLSWEAAIKTSRMELELLTNVNMILFYEKGIRKSSKNDLSLCIGI